jgi:hypothetical protein
MQGCGFCTVKCTLVHGKAYVGSCVLCQKVEFAQNQTVVPGSFVQSECKTQSAGVVFVLIIEVRLMSDAIDSMRPVCYIVMALLFGSDVILIPK